MLYEVGRLTILTDMVLRQRVPQTVENLSDEKIKTCAKRVGYRKLGYFKWWVMSDENWVRSDEWLFSKNHIAPWLLSFFSSSMGWFFTRASTVPRPKYSQPSFSSLKTSFFFFFVSLYLSTWNLKALHKYLSVKDIRFEFQSAHFSWGGRQCKLGNFFYFFLRQFWLFCI